MSKPNQEQEDTSTNIATKVLIETEGKKEDSNENESGQAEPNPQ